MTVNNIQGARAKKNTALIETAYVAADAVVQAATEEPLADATIAVAAEDTNVVAITIQLLDADGSALAVRGSVFAYISDDENGDSIAATAPDGGWAIGTDGLLIPVVANKAAILVSEADGDIDINMTESGTAAFYVIIVLPNGTLVASEACSFTA